MSVTNGQRSGNDSHQMQNINKDRRGKNVDATETANRQLTQNTMRYNLAEKGSLIDNKREGTREERTWPKRTKRERDSDKMIGVR